jgi:hypothetical protein
VVIAVDNLNRYLMHYRKPGTAVLGAVPKVVCADGTGLSIQASVGHYCIPRSNRGPWTHVEIGFPDTPLGPMIEAYAEEPKDLRNSVYAYVPIDLVWLYLATHGGMINEVPVVHGAGE